MHEKNVLSVRTNAHQKITTANNENGSVMRKPVANIIWFPPFSPKEIGKMAE